MNSLGWVLCGHIVAEGYIKQSDDFVVVFFVICSNLCSTVLIFCSLWPHVMSLPQIGVQMLNLATVWPEFNFNQHSVIVYCIV